MKKLLKNNGVQSLIASVLCVIGGMLIGYIVLLFINKDGASEAIMAVMKNFLNYSKSSLQMKNLGNTLVKTAPLIMCSLSVLFCYKVGLFNIGVAGQYVAGTCLALYASLQWGLSWFPCMVLAIVAGSLLGLIVGILKAYCNVNEVISGIMLNWIGLYLTNMLLNAVKEPTSPYTIKLNQTARQALLPNMGLDKLFNGNAYVTIAIPMSIIIAIIIWILLDMTKFGYELKATGYNKNAAKYCGMAEKRNIIVTLMIGGALAGLGGSLLYQTGFEQWSVTTSTVPGMGFNGIAAAFLGGLNPLGTVVASYFIQHITNGGAFVDKSLYCSQISDLISSLIIYLCGFVFFLKYAMNARIKKSEDKAAAKKGGQA